MAAEPVMTADELTTFIRGSFPGHEPPHIVEEVGPGRTVVRLPAEQAMLRPGGTVSGPTLMTMADTAAWAATLAEIGPVALSVTSHLSSHVRRPHPPP